MNKRAQQYACWLHLFVLALCLAGKVSAQQIDIPSVTISGTNITLEKVFKAIEKQTGFKVQYSVQFVDVRRKVHLDVHGKPISYVLNLVLGDKLKFRIDDKRVILSPRSADDPVTAAETPVLLHVTGVIKDDEGNPVIGATIAVNGTPVGTTANEQGQFSLFNVKEGSLLTVTSIGYQTMEAAVPDNGRMMLTMGKSVAQLREFVANGYQEIHPENITGSMVKVNNKLFNRVMSAGIMDRLQDVVSGLTPDRLLGKNSKNDFTIRGVSTIGTQNGADARPLIVLDNFPYDGNIDNINPNDVESITVLKDAASSAVWGARAGNGVIVIKSRQGKYGEKMHLNFNSFVGMSGKPDLYYRPKFTSEAFIEIEEFLFSKNFYNRDLLNVNRRPVISPVVEILVAEREGKITHDVARERIDKLKTYDVRRDYEKYLYQPAINQQYSLSVDGGSDKMNYIFSLGYDKNRSNLVGDQEERISMRAFNNTKLSERLTLQTGITFSQTNTENNSLGGKVISGATSVKDIYPYARLADENGKPLPTPKDYRRAYLDTVGGGRLLDWMYRPLEEQRLSDHKNRRNDIVLYLGANYKINQHLNLDVKYQFENTYTDERNFHDVKSYYSRNLINTFSPVNGSFSESAIPYGNILDTTMKKLYSHNVRTQFNYARIFEEKHKLEVLLGGEIKQFRDYTSSGRLFGYNEQGLPRYMEPGIVTVPTYNFLLSTDGRVPVIQASNRHSNRFLSVYSNLAYTYDHRYVLTASARRDASNLFGVATNRKWNPLWSAGAGWIVSKERFYHSSWLELMKLRVAYGYSGNANNNESGAVTLEEGALNEYNDLRTLVLIAPPNPSLRWEKINTANLGLDLTTAGNRINFTIEYYLKKAEDLLIFTPADISSGFDYVLRNSASLKGRGLDIDLNTLNVDGDFKWKTDFLFSHSKFKLNDFDRQSKAAYNLVSSGVGINPISDQYAFAVVSYKFKGLDPQTGNPLGYLGKDPSTNYTGIFFSEDPESLVFHGSGRPQIFGSIRNTLSYAGLSLSFNISYRFKYFFRNPYALNYVNVFNAWSTEGYQDYLNRWQKPGDELITKIPSFNYPVNPTRDEFYINSSANVEKGDHIRLNDVVLEYSLSDRLVLHKIRSLVLRAYAYNLGIIWKKTALELDPSYGDRLPFGLNLGVALRL